MNSSFRLRTGKGPAVLLILLALVPVIATLLPLLRQGHWWIRIFDFPRLQISALGLMVLALALVWRRPGPLRWGVAAVLAGCLAWQGVMIYPYSALAKRQALDTAPDEWQDTISLLVANVLMTNRRAEGLLGIIEAADPDLVLLLEPDDWWQKQLWPLEERYPQVVSRPLDNTYGMILYSRLELVEPQIHHLIKEDIPSIHTRVVLPSGRQIHLWGVHPQPPAPTEADDSTERDVELLLVADQVEELGQPTIVMGDLNDVAWSYTTDLFLETSQLLDPRIGRGMFNSYNAHNPLLRWPLDHVFFSEDFLLTELRRLGKFGSDHFPIYAEMVLKPEVGKGQDKPERPDEDDLETIQDKLDRLNEQD
ncbi:MAG: endonuclease/exonuclease/phosphatase family protein [Candidatus Competibacteraceae bacterium]|nr:endonuclease/exonuclease/phosphatase family protein [Candidatus Competibacteraceae bacterium]